MFSQTRSANSIVDDSGNGTEVWGDPTFAKVNDGTYAQVDVGSFLHSHYLKATDFGFTIPVHANIVGVKVEIKRFPDVSGAQDVEDDTVALVRHNRVDGANNGLLFASWALPDTYYVYGGSSDMWLMDMFPADINSSDFGCALAVTGNGGVANVDHIRVTVYYEIVSKLIIAKSGFNVLTEPDLNNYVFSSDFNTLKYYASGQIRLNGGGNDYQSIFHGLGYVPFFIINVQTSINANLYGLIPYSNSVIPSGTDGYAYADANYLYFRTITHGGGNVPNLTFYYKIFKNNLGL